MIDHWFDFICPYCYVGQGRTAILRRRGLAVEELSLQIHPEIGPGGVPAPARIGPGYDALAAEAERGRLPLAWGERIAYSRPALVLSELVRLRHHDRHPDFVARVFDAYFGRGLDIERSDVLAACLEEAEIQGVGSSEEELAEGERGLLRSAAEARAAGVTGTPAWRIDGELIVGLQPARVFESLRIAGG
ncbi:MAG TPA: DsbA family protein [Solirubrobacterales bacterium]